MFKGESTKLARVIIKKYRSSPMVLKNTKLAHVFVIIDKTSLSIFIFPHPIRGTRSVCSIGHSPNSCEPLFNGLTLDAQRLALGTVSMKTKQTRLTYVQVLSSPAPPAHQVAHLQGHAGRTLRCVRASRSGRTFACACSPLPSGLS